MASPHVGIIHKVVVQQGIVVVGFQSYGRHKDVIGLFTPEVIGHKHEHGTDALATERQYILYRLIE